MPSGGSTSQVTDNDPWDKAQPFLQDIMGQAQNLHATGAGSELFPGSTVAPLDSRVYEAFKMTDDLARGGNTSQPFNFGSHVLNKGGITDGMMPGINTLSGVASGGGGISPDKFSTLYNEAGKPGAASTYLTDMLMPGDINPFIQQIADTNAERIGDQVSSKMSGSGRYGSFAHGAQLADRITEANNPLFASAYESDQNRRLQAAGLMDSTRQGNLGTMLNAAQGEAGVLNTNVANAMNASQGLLGAYGQGLDRATQAATLLPAFDEFRYSGADKIGGIGSFLTDRAQTERDAEVAKFNQEEQMPWAQLSKYLGSVSGLSPLIPQTGQSTTEQEKNLGWWQMLFGG